MNLRAQLVGQLAGALPAAAQLPEGYALELVSDRKECQHCGGRLRRARTSTHRPVGLMFGQPLLRRVQKECVRCKQTESPDIYHQLVPRQGKYAYDLIVEVGLARLRDLRQDAEICRDLERRWGLSLPLSAIGLLVNSFLDGLAAVHQAHAPVLRRQLEHDGGYALHLDGTCEPGTDVIFTAMAAPQQWMLQVGKMTTENASSIGKLLVRTVEHFGTPLAVMRDLSANIKRAKQEVIPEVRDLICHYHFLENVGSKLCGKPHAELTKALRRANTRVALRSLRKDLVRGSKRCSSPLSAEQIERLTSHPNEAAELDAVTLRRLVAYLLLRWLADYGTDLHGEYFPFDLPILAFYRRGRQLGEWLDTVIALEGFPDRTFSTLRTMSRHLAPLRQDAELVAAAERLEKAAASFEELRQVLRLTQLSREPLLRGRELTESREKIETIPTRMKEWREVLRKRMSREKDTDKRDDQRTVLNYLETYHKQLVGHVIPLEGRSESLLVSRTNNVLEQRFGTTKKGLRRKVGAKKLTRHIQAMRAEALLVANLDDALYLDLVYGGSLANLPARFADYWSIAQIIRRERQQPKKDHPLPTSKKALRQPNLLDNLEQMLTIFAHRETDKTAA